VPGLIEELALALEQMADATCPSMRSFWLTSTLRERRDFPGAMTQRIFVPPGLARFKKAKRSKYEALATFRHAVVWRLPRCEWSPASAAGREYFVPCRDEPPFAAGGADARSAHGKKRRDAVSRHLIVLIKAVRLAARKQDRERSGNDLHVADALAAKAVRKTLRDVLRLDDLKWSSAFHDAPESTEWD
jgi:hypothetical protein